MSNLASLQAEMARIQKLMAEAAAKEAAETAKYQAEIGPIMRKVESRADSARKSFERAVAEETAVREMFRGFIGNMSAPEVKPNEPKSSKPRGDSLPIKVESGPLAFVVCVAGRPETAETISKSDVATAGHYAIANAYVKRHLTSEERSWRGSSLARKLLALMTPEPTQASAPALRLVG